MCMPIKNVLAIVFLYGGEQTQCTKLDDKTFLYSSDLYTVLVFTCMPFLGEPGRREPVIGEIFQRQLLRPICGFTLSAGLS